MKLLLPQITKYNLLPVNITEDNVHIAHAILALFLILIVGVIFKIKYRKEDKRLIPAAKLSLLGIIEIVGEYLLNIMRDIIGKNADRYFPVIGTLFFYLLICNLMGVIPGFEPPTDNINTNAACALIVFVYFNYIGIKTNGFRGYLRNIAGPILWLAPLIVVIELISIVVRPISLSIRLMGNMVGDHLVIDQFSKLLPWLIPVPFMILAAFIAIIQAFVFTLLSIIYIALAEHKSESKEEI